MIRGTTLAPVRPTGLGFGAVRRYALADIEETRLEIEDRGRARALDFLIANAQSDRQERIQKMALDTATKAQAAASEESLAILGAGAASQQRLNKTLLWTAVAGFVLVGATKLFGKKQKPDDDGGGA